MNAVNHFHATSLPDPDQVDFSKSNIFEDHIFAQMFCLAKYHDPCFREIENIRSTLIDRYIERNPIMKTHGFHKDAIDVITAVFDTLSIASLDVMMRHGINLRKYPNSPIQHVDNSRLSHHEDILAQKFLERWEFHGGHLLDFYDYTITTIKGPVTVRGNMSRMIKGIPLAMVIARGVDPIRLCFGHESLPGTSFTALHHARNQDENFFNRVDKIVDSEKYHHEVKFTKSVAAVYRGLSPIAMSFQLDDQQTSYWKNHLLRMRDFSGSNTSSISIDNDRRSRSFKTLTYLARHCGVVDELVAREASLTVDVPENPFLHELLHS